MFEEEFNFKFPELKIDFEDIEPKEYDKTTIQKINEYLDEDIADQDLLLKRLIEFERKLEFGN
jgi:hypothetical protein